MRVRSRIALVVVALFSLSVPLFAQLSTSCPLSLADTTAPSSNFELSPHGIFRSGNLVYALRGQVLTTYTVNETGNLQIAREDFIGSMAGRESEGGVAFANGFLYVSSEAGLEIFNLTNVRAGGSAPTRVARIPGLHYRRLSVSGNRLAGLFPATDLPCYPAPTNTSACQNQVVLFDITTASNPVFLGTINSYPGPTNRGINDVAFVAGNLVLATEAGVFAYNISNPANPIEVASDDRPARWMVTNGTNFLAAGTDEIYSIYTPMAGVFPFFNLVRVLPIPTYLRIERANDIRFSRNAFYDEANARFVTLIDEVNPMTLEAARTIAFDVFDFRVAPFEGSAPRIYEDVSMTSDDEVKHNPLMVGNYVYVLGETTGLQSWGSCGVATGRIELDSPRHLTCGGGEIHGYVTGPFKITGVELFLNGQSLGPAVIDPRPRADVDARTPVYLWRVGVNLDLQ
ncbi:MAG: hypothetical protein M3Q69_17020, partial [Acidobacteriota bacterium]|nr:hypothetical protein [Acidobacteriota bacterium]